MRTHMALRLVLSAAVATAIATPAFAEDASGGPEKSIAPKSLSNTPLSNAPAPTSGSSSPSQDAKDAGSGGAAASDAARKAGGSPQGRNNTMDDSGGNSAGPGEGSTR